MILHMWRWAMLGTLIVFQLPSLAADPRAWGYVGWWLPQSWRSVPMEEFDRILFFDLKVNGDGAIGERHDWPDGWGDLLKEVKVRQKSLDIVLTMFAPEDFNHLFSSVEAMQRLMDEATSLAGPTGVAGLQLDFEIYDLAGPQPIENFRTFLRMLSTNLHQMSPPRSLSVFLPVGAEPTLYDSDSLGVVDYVVLQGYDVHWRGSKMAGPVAPLAGDDIWTWEKMVKRGDSLGVARSKLMLGFPLFGYEWPVKGIKQRSSTLGVGSTTSFAPLPLDLRGEMRFSVQERVREFGAIHDPLSGSSHYHFKGGDGQFIEGWFEDWWSLGRKIDYLISEKIGGIAFFLLGYDGGHLVNFFVHERKSSRSPEFPLPGADAKPVVSILKN